MTDHTEQTAPAATRPRIRPARWVALGVAAGAGALAVALLPPPGRTAPLPPLSWLTVLALLIAALTCAALYQGIRRDLGLAPRVAAYTLGGFALIALTKFALGPRAMYEVNQLTTFESWVTPDDPAGATLTALGVLALYLASFTLIYRVARRRLVVPRAREGGRWRRRGLLILITGVVLLVTGIAMVGAVVLLGAVMGASLYVGAVFASTLALLIGTALAGAAMLLTLAVHEVAERARLVGDAAVLVSFFWLGVAVLVLYHALWIVYVLVLTTVWPLKVVVPK
ncbi:MAG TPA: hypothetical protein VHF25_15690 [Nitriliruptorales bacterium]|nr:hypothetical protein [Nitriliruptorales bacterium]